MKKMTLVSLYLFSLFLHVQNLNLGLLSAEPVNCIENNMHIAKFLDACQNNSTFAQKKMNAISKMLIAKIVCMCSLSEKLQLREFTKQTALFKKLFSELIGKIAATLKIDQEKIMAIAENIQLSDHILSDKNTQKSALLCNNQKMQIERIANNLLISSGSKLSTSILKIILFLNPTSKKSVGQDEIKSVLIRTLSVFSGPELDSLEKITNSKVFVKIANTLDSLTDNVISIIKADA